MFTDDFVFDLQRFKNIKNETAKTLVSGTSGNDSIYNGASKVTITGGEGNDSIDNRKYLVKIAGDKGNDSISNYYSFVTIESGAGNDIIYNSVGDNVTIDAGDGNDSIKLFHSDNVTVNGGAGNDSIFIDWISHNNTINGGAGNDLISIEGARFYLIEYKSGDGNDKIYGFNSTSTLSISGGSYSTTKSGNNIIVKVGEGKISLMGAATLSGINIKDSLSGVSLSKKTINGTSGNDSISNTVSSAKINALDGNDSIINGELTIAYGINSLINKGGDSVTIAGGAGNDTIESYYGFDVSISGGKGDDFIFTNEGNNRSTLTGGEGNDYISNDGSTSEIYGGAGNDSIENYSSFVTINGGAGDDYVFNRFGIVSIDAGSGNDTIYNEPLDVTISGGTGNDLISLYSGTHDLIKYKSGDGNDKIYGFNEDSTLSISGGSYSTTKSGKNIIVTVGNGKITLQGAATLSKVNITGTEGGGTVESSWKLSGTTATFGTSSKTLVTVSGVKSTSGLSLSGKVVTVAKAALGTGKVTVSNGYTLALASDVTKTSTKKAWSLSNSTATYKQTTAAGYKLASDSKSISYTKKATTTLTTVTGVKSTSGLSVSGKVVTVAASSLNAKKVTISSGYTLALADDVTKTSTKKAWSLSNSTATYKQTTAAGYKLASDSKSISYTKKATKTLATINGAKSKAGFTLSGNTIKLKTSSLSSKVSVSGSYAFEFAADYNNAKITGSSSDDTIISAGENMTIEGGKGNDSLTGGTGADVFIYSEGDGNDVITNYDTADRIRFESGAVKVSTSDNDVVFTVGEGKITVKDGKGKNITYFENDNERVYPEKSSDVEYNKAGTSAKLKVTYNKDTFEPNDYSSYADTLVTINAAAVEQPLKITGNKKKNKITGTGEDDTIYGGTGGDTIFGGAGNDELYGEAGNDSLSGGAGDDSLWGGKGSDTLFGGEGEDIFYYDSGDGNDVIMNFNSSMDKIRVLSGEVGNPTANSSGDVTFKVDDGKIVIKNGANKYIPIYLGQSGNNVVKEHGGT